MAELTMKEMECLQRGLGIIEGVAACGSQRTWAIREC